MSELVDLVDKNGALRIQGLPRHEAPDYPDLHMRIVIVVAFDGLQRLLVQQRGAEKFEGGKYDLICGAIFSGERPSAAGIREGAEETGVTLSNLHQVQEGVNVYGHWRHLFLAEATGEPTVINPREVMRAAYLWPDEVHQLHTNGGAFVNGCFEDIKLTLGHTSISATHPFIEQWDCLAAIMKS